MTRRVLAPAYGWFFTLTLACSASPQTAAGDAEATSAGCDRDALARLSEELAPLSVWVGAGRVWAGVEEACADALPPAFIAYFSPPEARRGLMTQEDRERLDALIRAACPAIDAVRAQAAAEVPELRARTIYDGCEFGRFEVTDGPNAVDPTSGGMVVFAFYHWLIDQGIEPATARPLTRALLAKELTTTVMTDVAASFELPVGDGELAGDGVLVQIDLDGIVMNSRRVMRLQAGEAARADEASTEVHDLHLELEGAAAKYRSLAPPVHDGAVALPPVLVFADARTPTDTVGMVMHSAKRAGFDRVAIMAAPRALGRLVAIEVELAPQHLQGSRASGLYGTKQPKGGSGRLPSSPHDADGDGRPPMITDVLLDDEHAHFVALPYGPTDGADEDAEIWGARGGPGGAGGGEPSASSLRVEIEENAYSVTTPGAQGSTTLHGSHETDAIVARAAELVRTDPSVDRVVVSARPGVLLAQVLAVLTAIRSRDCTDPAAGPVCRLHRVVWLDPPAAGTPPGGGGPSGGGDHSVELGADDQGVAIARRGTETDNRPTDHLFRGARQPQVRHGALTATGSLDAQIIRRIVRANHLSLGRCYALGLLDDPKLGGSVTLAFTITGTTGRVSSAEIAESTLGDPAVEACMVRAAQRWMFPKPKGATDVAVRYPLTLRY